MSPGAPSGLSLRTRLLLVVAIALLPVAALAIVGLLFLGRQQHAQAQQGLVEKARALTSAVDIELSNSVEALKILALSASLDSGDLRRFHVEARKAATARADWDGVALVDRSGNRLLYSAQAYGAPLPGGAAVVDRDSFDATLAGGVPSIGGIARGPGGRDRFAVRVPVLRAGEVRYVLTAVVKPDVMLEILTQQKLPPESVTSVFDASMKIVARSRNHDEFVGKPVSTSLMELIGGAQEGWGLTRTLESQEVYSAFSRSPRSAWSVAIGIPRSAVDGPIWRSYALWAAGLALSLGLGVLVSAWLARRVAGQLQRAHAELEASNSELEAFSYSVSHDLRAPVRAIDGFSRILLEEHAGALPAEGRRQLNIVSQKAKQMGKLIDDLLVFAQLARHAVARQRLQPRALVEECVEKLRSESAGSAARCEIGELPECDADPSLLRQVLLNLIGNAFKYSAKAQAPRVEVGCERRGGEDVFYVSDNGVGFDMKYAGKLFGVFQRLHGTDEFEGTGVGLAIVQRIVQRHGGRIWAHAEPGKGATFYFTIRPSPRRP